MKVNKQQAMFITSLVLLAAAIAYRVMNPFVQPRVDTLTYTGNTPGKAGVVTRSVRKDAGPGNEDREGDGSIQDKVVSQFVNKPDFSGQTHQDLFLQYQPPRPAAQKAEQTERKTAEKTRQTSDETEDPVADIRDIREYLTSYKIYGNYEGDKGKGVFLAKNKLVLVAKQGDRLDGKYVIDEITDSYIRFSIPKLNRTIRIDKGAFDNE